MGFMGYPGIYHVSNLFVLILVYRCSNVFGVLIILLLAYSLVYSWEVSATDRNAWRYTVKVELSQYEETQ